MKFNLVLYFSIISIASEINLITSKSNIMKSTTTVKTQSKEELINKLAKKNLNSTSQSAYCFQQCG